ncbi:MAG: transposase [Thermodesulfobacteriota bacterium]
MPNHLHGIIWIGAPPDGAGQRQRGGGICRGAQPCALEPPYRDGPPSRGVPPWRDAPLRRTPRSVGSLIAGFKSVTTRRINEVRHMAGRPVWQRNYYEHIIRDDESLNRIRQYICDNPGRWLEDPENPAALKKGSWPP